MTGPESGMSLETGMDASGMDFREVWLNQVGVGGDVGALELEAYVLGVLAPDTYTHNLIAQAINEHFIARGANHPVAYDDTGSVR